MTFYSTEPTNPSPLEVVNSATFGPAVRRAFHDMGRVDVTPYAIPWSGIDVPMVTDLPIKPNDRAEVNLLVGDGVNRMVYRRATDTWYRVDSGELNWTDVTLINSWDNVDPATYPLAGYLMDNEGFVHLRGRLDSGASGTVAFVLPAGYRPQLTENGPLGVYSTVPLAGTWDVQSNGNVTLFYTAGALSVFMSGISFDTRA